MAKSVGSTAIVAVAWIGGLIILIKVLPSLLSATRAGASGGPGGIPVNGYTLPYLFNGGRGLDSAAYAASQYASTGQSYYGSPLSSNNPDLAQAAAEIVNEAGGFNADGSPLTAAQQALVIPQYDSSTDNQFYGGQSLPGVSDDFLNSLAFSPADYQDSVSDYGPPPDPGDGTDGQYIDS